MTTMEKLTILTDAAKYDAACTSSGLHRQARRGRMGSTTVAGCCHTFSADGRCVTLLKVLHDQCAAPTTASIASTAAPTTCLGLCSTPRELAELTMEFYRRNYIEGLFLSSAVLGNPDNTTERMISVLRLLREEYRFWGYIHAKAIPGADPAAHLAAGHPVRPAERQHRTAFGAQLVPAVPRTSPRRIFWPLWARSGITSPPPARSWSGTATPPASLQRDSLPR